MEIFLIHEGVRTQVLEQWKWRIIQGVGAGLLAVTLVAPVAAESQSQFWPEIDTFYKVNSKVRLSFFVQQTRENARGEDLELGPNFDFYLKPLVKAKKFVFFQLDESKSRLLMVRSGYRYIPSTSSPTEQRVFFAATGRYPLARGVLVSDRNQVESRYISAEWSWRYRNQLTLERDVKVRSCHFAPYIQAETYYDSRYGKFSRTTEDVGVSFPIHKHVEIEPYYEHQNDTSKAPNRQINAAGLKLRLYF